MEMVNKMFIKVEKNVKYNSKSIETAHAMYIAAVLF